MKTKTPKSPKQNGFTLIELLVVIAIMATLATIGISAYRIAMEKAHQVSATAAMSNLVQACDNYFEDYSQLPLNQGVIEDQERLSDNDLMSILVGLESGEFDNSKRTAYFTYSKARGSGTNKYNGLDRSDTHARLYGPWKNKDVSARFYRLKFDYDFDQNIDEPSALGGNSQYGHRVLIYHLGRDGEVGPGKNQDNAYSYRTK